MFMTCAVRDKIIIVEMDNNDLSMAVRQQVAKAFKKNYELNIDSSEVKLKGTVGTLDNQPRDLLISMKDVIDVEWIDNIGANPTPPLEDFNIPTVVKGILFT